MRNFVFISPNFPTNYWRFCRELANNGLRVLGVGDQPYDELLPELRESLSEYYKVSTLENYDEVYRAIGFFIGKYGRIDWLESNNEYWLERDAMLRSGFQPEDMAKVTFKSGMKESYQRAGIPAARWHIVEGLSDCLAFAEEAGYPLIVKPDNGVGASQTFKLKSEAELEDFLRRRDPGVRFILEEFVAAEVNSYDAIYNSKGEPLFETGNVTPESIMDTVNNADNSIYYIVKDLAEDVRAAGRAAAKSFGVRSRFIHFEFFRLTEDQRLGKKGDVVALEVNMRPCGGFSPDMMNFAHSTDVYKIWADMIAFDRSDKDQGEHGYCAFAGRRDGKAFSLSDGALVTRYANALRMTGRIPDALADAMGNRFFIAVFPTKAEMEAFYADALRVIPGE